jgi:hypothetical protein
MSTVNEKKTTTSGRPARKNKKSLTSTLVGVGASVLVLFATVWIVGSAWKKSQD